MPTDRYKQRDEDYNKLPRCTRCDEFGIEPKPHPGDVWYHPENPIPCYECNGSGVARSIEYEIWYEQWFG